MLCPVDDTTLQAARIGGYPIHRCPQCLGVAVNGSLLREVRVHAALELHTQQGGAAVWACPVDGTGMKLLGYKGVGMCACPHCLNLWLAAGQLSRLLELVPPPKQADLSRIGQGSPTDSNKVDKGSFDGLGDILELAADVFGAISKLAD